MTRSIRKSEDRALQKLRGVGRVAVANELAIKWEIVAGRVRKELHNYRLLTHYVGNGEASKYLQKSLCL